LEKNGSGVIRWIKSNYKGLTIVIIMFVASLAINVYIGFGPSSSLFSYFSQYPTSNNIKQNVQPNSKVDPFVMRDSFYLNITMDGKRITIPSQIGIEQPLWHNHTLDKYGAPGMTMQGMTMPSMAPIYTNDNSGLIKIGSTVIRNYTLGDFFNIWGFDPNGKTVNASSNGKPISDFKRYVLKDKEQIDLNISTNK
jgi:hypothetical protein